MSFDQEIIAFEEIKVINSSMVGKQVCNFSIDLLFIHDLFILGGGGHRGTVNKPTSTVGVPGLAGVLPSKSLMELAARGMILKSIIYADILSICSFQ